MEDIKLRRAKKVVDVGLGDRSFDLAQLTEAIYTNDKLDALLEKEVNIPEEIEITLEGVEYIKGEKGEASEYPQEISINNLPEVQKVEITNLPSEKDDTKMLALLKEISQELKKKEQYDYDIEIDPALKEQLKGESGEDGKDGVEIFPEQIAEKLNTLKEAVEPEVIKGYKNLKGDIERLKNTPKGSFGGGFTQQQYLNFVQQSKVLVYNPDNTLLSVTDGNGSKTFGYTDGLLTSMTGTGWYRSKDFVYTDSKLTNVNVI